MSKPYLVIPSVIRYYKGVRKCRVLQRQPAMKTQYIKFIDTGEIVVAPIRLCHKKMKVI